MTTGIATISVKILEANFGKSILDNFIWDKIIEGQQNTHIWNRVRLFLKGENYSEIKSSFPSCDTQAKFILFQNIKKEIEKRIYIVAISSGTGKNITSQTLSSTLHLEGQTRYSTVLDRCKTKLDEKKMNSKFTKSHQWSLEKSKAVLTENNPEFGSKPSLFLTKTDSYRSTSHKNLQTQNNEDILIQLLYAWLHLTNSYIPPSYLQKKLLSNPYL